MSTTTRPPVRRPPGAGGAPRGGGWAPALTPRIAVRIAVLGGVAAVLLGILILRLWFLQVIAGEDYAAKAEGNRLRTVEIEAPRGNVIDRDGQVLVTNRSGTNVVARPRDLTGETRERVLRRLAPRLGIPVADLRDRVESGDGRPFESVILARNVDREVELYLSERAHDFPGIGLAPTYLRTYPEGALAAHVLGSTGRIGPEELDEYRKRGYQGNEVVGKDGVERAYEQFLRGTPGRRMVEVNAAGEPVGRGIVSSSAPMPGRDLQLSLELRTQRALERAMDEQMALNGATGAAGVALDPRTGEVLALASSPDYDPGVLVGGRPREIERILRDPRQPLTNRAIAGQYPVGSTFKAVTAAAALHRGMVTPDTLLESRSSIELYDQEFSNFRGQSHGLVNAARALEVSSDTYFYQLGDEFWKLPEETPLQDEAARFGLGEATGIDLPGEQDGNLPTPAWKRRAYAGSQFTDFQRSWVAGDTIQLTIGQGFFLATPLQMAVAYAAIANDGTVVTPTIGRRVLDRSGRVQRELAAGRPTARLGIAPRHLEAVREGLYRAANGAEGTATAVFAGLPEGAKVAGKTGTAEPGDGGEDHSWFVGYAPYDDPTIVVAVVIERGGTGANAAAPVVCEAVAAHLRVDPASCGSGALAN